MEIGSVSHVSIQTACSCSPLGIMDSGLCDNNGQCNCKVNVGQEVRDCTQCRDGYWNLTESNPEGCEGMTIYYTVLPWYFSSITNCNLQLVIVVLMELSLLPMDFPSVVKILENALVMKVPLAASVMLAWLVQCV